MQDTIIGIIAITILLVGIIIWRRPSVGRETPARLKPGNPLPEFTALSEDGERLSSNSLAGTPTVMLFVRGNWCPFCSRQVEDMTAHYKEITDIGGRLVIVTPKPLETTRRVAEMYGVSFDFWLDEDSAVVSDYGLLIENGVPGKEREQFGDNAVWPASLVIDADGVIRFTELSKTIMDRPSSDKLLRELKKLVA